MLQKYRICGALARQMLVNELNYRLNQLNLGVNYYTNLCLIRKIRVLICVTVSIHPKNSVFSVPPL